MVWPVKMQGLSQYGIAGVQKMARQRSLYRAQNGTKGGPGGRVFLFQAYGQYALNDKAR